MRALNHRHKQRLVIIGVFILGISLATGLILYACKNSIDLYYTPEQLQAQTNTKGKSIRLGGLVAKNSVTKFAGLQLSFAITDYKHTIKVHYTGILPDLFKEGQGVVVLGYLNASKEFIARQVLAKHDEKYKPPGI